MSRATPLAFAPHGATWCGMVLPDGTLAIAAPEVGNGPSALLGGSFRTLTPDEAIAFARWILDAFGETP